jgi:hypothetical protein
LCTQLLLWFAVSTHFLPPFSLPPKTPLFPVPSRASQPHKASFFTLPSLPNILQLLIHCTDFHDCVYNMCVCVCVCAHGAFGTSFSSLVMSIFIIERLVVSKRGLDDWPWGEPAPMLVPMVKITKIAKNPFRYEIKVSDFKSNVFLGLIWPLQGLTQKDKGTTNTGAALPWTNDSCCKGYVFSAMSS